MTGVDVSTTNVPKAEDDQSVTVDITSTLVPDDNVANEVETIPDDHAFSKLRKKHVLKTLLNVPQRYRRKKETTNLQLLLMLRKRLMTMWPIESKGKSQRQMF